jgi:hypothetical protein
VAAVIVGLMCWSALTQATDPDLIEFCVYLNVVGAFCAAGVLYFSLVAVRASYRCDACVSAGLIIEARSFSERARQESCVCLGLCAALLIACAAVSLVVMNNGAVQKTFLRLDLEHVR